MRRCAPWCAGCAAAPRRRRADAVRARGAAWYATDLQRGSDIARAAAVLAGGGLVAFPTETVHGLGAEAASAAAGERIFAAKGRPRHHPLIVHVADAARLDDWAVDVPDAARAL